MNLPNKLTLLRILLIPLILLFMLPLPGAWAAGWNAFVLSYGAFVALLLFAVASYTDYLDGHIARSRQLVTNMGKFLDPIADKMLVLAVMIALVERGRLTSLVPAITLLREFAVTGMRMLAAERGQVIAAGSLGKAKTVTQIVALLALLLQLGLLGVIGQGTGTVATLMRALDLLCVVAVILSLVMTIWSGLDYILRNRALFAEDRS